MLLAIQSSQIKKGKTGLLSFSLNSVCRLKIESLWHSKTIKLHTPYNVPEHGTIAVTSNSKAYLWDFACGQIIGL